MTPAPRQVVYTLLTVVTLAATAGRVARTEFVFEPSMYPAEGKVPREWPKARPAPMPTFSSNDRSRWAAVRALVDHGTFVVGHRGRDGDPTSDTGIVFEDGWKTVDKVLNPETRDFYSSKPPLLTLLVAGEYWLLRHTLGWTITGDTNKVVKAVLITFNVVPLALYLWMLRRLLERFAATEWAALLLFAGACFGTFLTTFAVTLNNHTPAAVTALAAIYPFLTAEDDRRSFRFLPLPALPSPGGLVAAGVCAGLTACLELPALAFAAALAVAVLIRDPRQALLFVVPAGLVFSSEFALNKLAVGEWLPLYAKFGGPWYQYAGSHWMPPPPGAVKHGIDWARQHESIRAYIFHCLIGHHGLFSLTPLWLLAFAGLVLGTVRGMRPPAYEPPIAQARIPAFFFPLVLVVSLTVIGYYLVKSDNYGGWTSGLRWLFWFTPLWLLAALPVADRLAGSRWGRAAGYAALAVSAFSAGYPVWNPWRHPWLYHLLESQGWVQY